MSAHLNGRCTIVRVWGVGRRWRHHHLVRHCVLQLGTLVIIWVGMRRNGSRRHRGSWPSTIWRRWICTRRWLHVCLRGRHLAHGRRVHRARRWHSRRVRHMLHEWSWHVRARGTRGRHSRHHWLSWICVRVRVNISTLCGLGCGIFLVRGRRHRGRNGWDHVGVLRGVLQRGEHLHVSLAIIRPNGRDLRSIYHFIVLERVKVILDVDWRTFLERSCPVKGVRRRRARFRFGPWREGRRSGWCGIWRSRRLCNWPE